MAAKSATPARPVLNITVETEKNIKEKKLYPVRERPFQPNLSVKPLTGKFYSSYEVADPFTGDFSALEEAIRRKQASKPADRVKEPETGNQEYGWCLEPVLPVDKSDRRFHHPRVSTQAIKIAVIIDCETKKFPKKPFTGIPFKL